MKKIAIFPGSFDPFTKGHEDIVVRGLQLFDEIIIGIGYNQEKDRYFPLKKIIVCIEKTFQKYSNVRVITYNELTSALAKTQGASYILRGLRNTTDFEYENRVAQVNKYLNNQLETVLLITSPKYASISSTLIREIHRYGADVNAFLPYTL